MSGQKEIGQTECSAGSENAPYFDSRYLKLNTRQTIAKMIPALVSKKKMTVMEM